MGIYGVILLLTGFFTSDKQLDKADGLNINLVGGIGMIVVGGRCSSLWARLRPIVVPEHVEQQDDPARPASRLDACRPRTHQAEAALAPASASATGRWSSARW